MYSVLAQYLFLVWIEIKYSIDCSSRCPQEPSTIAFRVVTKYLLGPDTFSHRVAPENLLCLLRSNFSFCFMCHLHLCCLDKITARQVFLRLKSSWRQTILLAISISLATVPCLTPALLFLGPWNTHVLLFIRLFWRDAKTKISNLKTHALLLFKSKLILVPGHCWSPRAVVLLPHGSQGDTGPRSHQVWARTCFWHTEFLPCHQSCYHHPSSSDWWPVHLKFRFTTKAHKAFLSILDLYHFACYSL